jgi:hypothetical protein
MEPRVKLREIAGSLAALFAAPTREDQIAAIREWDRHSVQYGAWLLQRERGLRSRLQETLRAKAQLEARVQQLEHGHEKTGLRAPIVRRPSEAKIMADELREVSKEIVFDGAMSDAFDVDESDWFETVD